MRFKRVKFMTTGEKLNSLGTEVEGVLQLFSSTITKLGNAIEGLKGVVVESSNEVEYFTMVKESAENEIRRVEGIVNNLNKLVNIEEEK